jgi:hypothetical protein
MFRKTNVFKPFLNGGLTHFIDGRFGINRVIRVDMHIDIQLHHIP